MRQTIFNMKRSFGALTALLALVLTLTWSAPVRAQERDMDLSEFYEALEPYGDWLQHRRHGYVWAPHVAEDDEWRPYTLGYWAPTEEHGWYWVSDEPFGWAAYHYGRWIDDEEFGWIWIPGTEWAPAWVAWRDSDEYVGWAPLPPEARWDSDRLVFRSDYYDAPRFSHYWIFAAPRYIGAPGLHRYIVPRARSVSIISRTRFVSNYHFHDRRIFNRGIDPRDIERRGRGSLQVLRIAPEQNRNDHGVRQGTVMSYRPTFRPAPSAPITPRVVFPSERRPDAQRREFGSAGPDRGPSQRGEWRRDRERDRGNEASTGDRRPVLRPSETSPPERRQTSRAFEGRDRRTDEAPRGDGRWRDQRSSAPPLSTGSATASPTPAPVTRQASPPTVEQRQPQTQPSRESRARENGSPPQGAAERSRGGASSGQGQQGGGDRSGRGRDGEKKKTPPGEKPPAS